MNVLLINGSPHKNGCTNAALAEVAKTLNEAGIETTIFHIHQRREVPAPQACRSRHQCPPRWYDHRTGSDGEGTAVL